MDPISEILESFTLNTDKLHTVQEGMLKNMKMGLTSKEKGLKMLPSYLYNLPEGTEKGTYIALDLGGTNFRVVQVDLLGKGKLNTKYLKYTIPDDLKTSTGEALFDFIANSVKDFLQKQNVNSSKLGFTFSFPCQQLNINKAVLMHWAKGFTASNVEGQDVVALLHEAFSRNKVNISCVAVINDTVGTLLAHAYESPNSRIGVILGTGTNAAYIEQCSKMEKNPDIKSKSGSVLVNIEWGAFDNEKKYIPFTAYDDELDAATPMPNQQRFEKIVSGLYLGEITRLALVDLVRKQLLFKGQALDTLNTPYSLKTEYLSEMESDGSSNFDKVEQVLIQMGITSTVHERQIVKSIGQQVGTRSARLAGAVLSAVLIQSDSLSKNETVVIAIDGSLFEHYPHYQSRIEAALQELLKDRAKLVKLELARDGSSVGAALGALMASQE